MKASRDYTSCLQSISASGRWLRCTASLEHNHGVTVDNDAVKLGSLIHDKARQKLECYRKGEQYMDYDDEVGEVVNEYFVHFIKKLCDMNATDYQVEKELKINWYGIEKKGIIDLLIENDEEIYICDLKSGYNRVAVEEDGEPNYQLAMYAIGLIQEKPERQNKKITLAICQPTIKNIHERTYTVDDLTDFYNSKLSKMNEIQQRELEYAPHTVACKYCNYRIRCAERFRQGVV